MARTKRNHKYEDDGHPLKSHRRNTRVERFNEFEADYIRKNKNPIITL